MKQRAEAVIATARPVQVLAAAMVFSLAFNMWMGRATTFSADEIAWFIQSPDLSLSEVFHPYVGHLVATSKVVYKLILETAGPEYWIFRLLAALSVVAVAGALFCLIRKSLNEWMALAISLVILFFGGDPIHVLVGNGFTILFAIFCGLMALLLADRDQLRALILASAVLCLGVVTYSLALPFVLGVAALLILGRRWTSLWVPAVPLLIYFAWWLWSQDLSGNSHGTLELSRLALTPAWGYQTISSMLSHLSGLDYDFTSGGSSIANPGPVLSLAFFVAIGFSLARGENYGRFWASAIILLTLWALAIVVPTPDRLPTSTRYMFPVAIVAALVWSDSFRRIPRNRASWVALTVVVFVSCLGGLAAIRDAGVNYRNTYAVELRAGLAGIEAAKGLDLTLKGDDIADREESAVLNLPFRAVDDLGKQSVKLYREAIERYGSLGYSAAELEAQGQVAAQQADLALVRAVGQPLVTPAGGRASNDCLTVPAGSSGLVEVPLTGRELLIRNQFPESAALFAGRFSTLGIPLGEVAAGESVALPVDPGRAGQGLSLRAAASKLEFCRPTRND